MGQQRTNPLHPVAEFVTVHVGMLGEGDGRRRGMQQMIRIDTVNHVDVMSHFAQRMRQAIDVHRIPAEAIRRVERRQVKKLQRFGHLSLLLRIAERLQAFDGAAIDASVFLGGRGRDGTHPILQHAR